VPLLALAMSWSFDRCAIIASVVTLLRIVVAKSAAAALPAACCELAHGWEQPVIDAVRATTASTAGIVRDFFTIADQTCSASKGANGMLRTTNQAATNSSVTIAAQRWCCQPLIRRPVRRP
jgi:hypothetical protein